MGWNPGKVSRAIREGLPIGTPARKVGPWLRAQSFHALPWVETTTGKVVGMTIENVPVTWMGDGSINIELYYDDNDLIVGYDIRAKVDVP
jgi:hypothetical protein